MILRRALNKLTDSIKVQLVDGTNCTVTFNKKVNGTIASIVYDMDNKTCREYGEFLKTNFKSMNKVDNKEKKFTLNDESIITFSVLNNDNIKLKAEKKINDDNVTVFYSLTVSECKEYINKVNGIIKTM